MRSVLKLLLANPQHQIYPLVWSDTPLEPFLAKAPNLIYLPHPPANLYGKYLGWLSDRFVRPSLYKKIAQNVDIIHFTSPFELDLGWPAINLGIPKVVTIHDLMPVSHPQIVLKGKLAIFRPIFSWQANILPQSNGLLFVSNYSWQQYRLLLDPQEKTPCQIAHIGANEIFRPYPQDQVIAYRKSKQLPEKFILYVGGFSPNKNLERLFQAIEEQDLPPLVIAGPDPGHAINQLSQRYPKSRVISLGYLKYEELPLLYNAATLFIFPSLVEGFGLPVVEAMACQTPTICSHSASLPEIVGEQGITFNPLSYKELRDCLVKTLNSPEKLQFLAQLGGERAALFSWRICTEKTLAAYSDFYQRFHKL